MGTGAVLDRTRGCRDRLTGDALVGLITGRSESTARTSAMVRGEAADMEEDEDALDALDDADLSEDARGGGGGGGPVTEATKLVERGGRVTGVVAVSG